jgi:hypothetical protein
MTDARDGGKAAGNRRRTRIRPIVFASVAMDTTAIVAGLQAAGINQSPLIPPGGRACRVCGGLIEDSYRTLATVCYACHLDGLLPDGYDGLEDYSNTSPMLARCRPPTEVGLLDDGPRDDLAMAWRLWMTAGDAVMLAVLESLAGMGHDFVEKIFTRCAAGCCDVCPRCLWA